ncbi:MAG: phosphopyruvate hydratase [Ruminococcaceae bacterium]|nr:phosphopyruvate hydratase [Oscillospiraceae bacterium]
MRPTIQKITAREILDSRGNPTVEATVVLESGAVGVCAVPSGASTGKYEAHEKRDGDPLRYGGKGVLCAVASVEKQIAPALCGRTVLEQKKIDDALCSLDGTPNKHRLGANAILAVSLACAHAAANHLHLPLYRHIGGIRARALPTPMFNVLNGGAHAENCLDVQEFMLVPHAAKSFPEAMRQGSEIYHTLGEILRKKGLSTAVGDEGGYAPDLSSPEEALELLCEAIERAGYRTSEVGIALDAAAGEWQDSAGGYLLPKTGQRFSTGALIDYWSTLLDRFPILSIEDPFAEEDTAGWRALTARYKEERMLVGDDLFVTSTARLRAGIREGLGNAILIKPNQIGTLSETLEVVQLAQNAGYRVILSHRSGETEDTSIADIALGVGAGFLKSGAPARSERLAKYNRLLRLSPYCDPPFDSCTFAFAQSHTKRVMC